MTSLPPGYDASNRFDTEGVYGNTGNAPSGTQFQAADVDTELTYADYFGTQTDTITFNHTTPTALHRVGIVTTPANLVVKDVTTSQNLVLTTDFTVTTTGSGASQTYSITRNNSSVNSADGDTITVSYQWGNDAAFSSAQGLYGTNALTYGTYGSSTSSNVLYPGISSTLDNEHVGLLVGGTQPNYAAEPLLPQGYSITETDTTTVNWPPTPGVNPAYRAPNLGIGFLSGQGEADTTWTDRPLTTGTPRNDLYATYPGTLDSYYVGAPVGLSSSSDAITVNHTTPTALLNPGVVTASVVAVTNGGHTTAQTDTLSGTNFNHTTPFALTKVGITTAPGSIVVTDTTTSHVLVSGTDYTLTPSGSGSTLTYSIIRVNTSVNSADNNTVTVAYSYGNAAYFATQPLVLNTDYTLATSGNGDSAVTTVTRVNSSTVIADGDPISVSYNYGSFGYYNSNLASGQQPLAPTIGSVTAVNEGVNVNWTAPSGTIPVNGYVVQCSSPNPTNTALLDGVIDVGGTAYAAANATSFVFGGVNGHGELLPNVPYAFRVAAWNTAGVGRWSAWSATASALNTNAVPTGSLDPVNTVDAVYAPDGTVHSGTNLGSGGSGPRPPQSVNVTSPSTGNITVSWSAPSNSGNPEEGPSGYTVTLSSGPSSTVLSNVTSVSFSGQTTGNVVTVTVTARGGQTGDYQSVSAAPQNITVA